MGAGFNYITDLYYIYHVVQNTMIRYPKDLIISSLKEFFSKDSKYHYVNDKWGFPNTPDHTGLPLNAGYKNDLTTRVWIGEKNRFDTIYYPSVAITAGSFNYKPLSLNRDQFALEYKVQEFIDGYGNRVFSSIPDKFVGAGAWEGSLSIEISSRGLRERDDLIELISLYLIDLNWNNLYRAGVSIKPDLSISSPSEVEDRNDKLFKQTITINIRGEWRKEIPISTFVDIINFCVEFGSFQEDGDFLSAPNLQINTYIETSDFFIFDNLNSPLRE
jgi:hypothetical protein